jgi:Zn-dependent protease with chaperone function
MRFHAHADERIRLVGREQTRRRAILMGIGALLVLALSPLFSHHVVPGADAVLAGRSHLIVLCLVALHALFAPVHGLFHLLFLGGLLHAAGDRVRAALLARRSLAPLREERPRKGDAFWIAGRTAGVGPDRIRVVSGLPAPAFTIGWWRPRVYIARETAEHLTARQLAAVIAHEGAHLRRRDPLRLSVLRFLSCTLFWLPAFKRLAADIADEVEILADDAAAAVTHPLVLASAILQIAREFSHGAAPAAATGFHRADLIDRRVRRLLGQEPVPSSHLTRRSLLGAGVALGLVIASGTVMAHPLPDTNSGDETAHCMHHDAPVVHHLFCLFDRAQYSHRDCPHEAL